MSEHPEHAEFSETCLPHRAAMLSYARRVCRNTAQAEDLVQDTFVRAMTAWAEFDGRNVKAWLFKILRNHFVSELRNARRKHELVSEQRDAVLASLYGAPIEMVESAERAVVYSQTIAVVDGLQPQFRDTFERFARGDRYKQIALDTGVPIGTVMSRLARARRDIKTALSTQETV